MNKKTNIIEQISQIVGDKRISKQQLKEAEGFLESYDSNEVNHFLKQQWYQANSAPSETNLTFTVIHKRIQPDKVRRAIKTWLAGAIAAAVIIGIVYMGWILTTTDLPHHIEYLTDSSTINKPNSTTAIVLKTESNLYELESNAIEIQYNGLAVNESEQVLELNKQTTAEAVVKQSWSKLIVPRGKDFYLKLADGTEVWINAGSTLAFPNFFQDDQRLVKLDGEAYFKVKSDEQHPFFVETPHEKVCVTGTQFNVCTYSDELMSRITLAEGRVSVTIDNEEHLLLPGEQLQQTYESGEIKKVQVDVTLYTSWKDGLFEFNDISLQEISYRLSKWYDVEFHFDNKQVSMLRFSGMTKQEYDLEYFLQIIAKTTNVKFEKHNSEIHVFELK